jgi:hypothetical protein
MKQAAFIGTWDIEDVTLQQHPPSLGGENTLWRGSQ